VTTTVKYTSPKGQNSYSRHIEWNFDQLHQGIRAAQATRARQSTTAARRQRERSLMTSGLRVTILRRDGFRCRMCGASAADGAVLHVDHITPVSRDGQTVPENLQTLCESCNLGKSNKFIG
jgi:5-methylcytosine-specific restriction endonuclease McrA